jgi:uncharacterized membrane protein YfcA
MITGSVMGALGGGGAILTIPILIYLLHLSPHEATTASLVIVGVGAVAGMVGHHRHGRVRVADALVLAAVGTVGTYAGSWLSASVAPEVLVILLAALLVVVAGLMLKHAGLGDADQPDPPLLLQSRNQLGKVVAVAVGVGLLTGFFGVGGGFAIVPALTLLLRYSVPTAVGTSLLVITLNSATAFAARLGQGVSLDWPLVLAFAAGAVLGSVGGGAFGRRISPARLTRGFAVLLLAIAAYMLVQAVLSR